MKDFISDERLYVLWPIGSSPKFALSFLFFFINAHLNVSPVEILCLCIDGELKGHCHGKVHGL